MPLSPGTVIEDRYELLAPLAEGGFAAVWRVRHRVLRSEHALKVLRVYFPQQQARLLEEGRAAARLNHPNIARVTDAVTVDGGVGLVVELVPGPTLEEWLKSGDPWTLAELRRIGEGILRGVAAAHAAGLVHRDLKPGNILLSGGPGAWVPKVVDFGLVRDLVSGAGLTVEGVGMGTPGYMAPEQYTDAANADERSDLFSLGVVLYELLSGQPPFGHGPAGLLFRRAREGEFAPLGSLRPDLPEGMVEAVESALSPDPAGRPRSCLEMLALWGGEPRAGSPWMPTLVPGSDSGQRLSASTLAAGVESTQIPPDRAPQVRLPVERDAFVGRKEDLLLLAERLAEARLVTVLGAGGTGKTRLVTRYAWTSTDRYPGGLWFCDLSEARSLDGILHATATALDVPLGSDDPVLQLGRAIRGRGRCLVLFDNVEQVAELASGTLGRWLDGAEEARFLATSRVQLQLRGEAILSLEPLDTQSAAALFEQRARAQVPAFATTPANQTDILAIVGRLDGLPLAIELAAARMRVLPVHEIRRRLSEQFRLLAARGGERPARHATLRACLDWSWELLAPAEQDALARLTVFQGGFTLEAAEAVLGDDALERVSALVESSLLRRDEHGRFGMLVSVHEYAAEKLADDARGQMEKRHVACFREFGRYQSHATLFGHGGLQRWRALQRELDNLLVGNRRAQAHGDIESAALLALAAWDVLGRRGPLDFGGRLLSSIQADGLPRHSLLRGRVLHECGNAALYIGDGARAKVYYKEALSVYEAAGCADRELTIRARCLLMEGRSQEAIECLERRIAMPSVPGEEYEVAGLTYNLSLYHMRLSQQVEPLSLAKAAMARAVDLMGVALDLARQTGERRLEGMALNNTGLQLMLAGRLEASREALDVALAISREVGDQRLEHHVLVNLGYLFLAQGLASAARSVLDEALLKAAELGIVLAAGPARWLLGESLRRQGDLRRARESLDSAIGLSRASDQADLWLEGRALSVLAGMDLAESNLSTARDRLDKAELLLRGRDRLGLGHLLCTRAALESALGNPTAAAAALAEAEALADALMVTPRSELSRAIAEVRRTLTS